MSEIQLESTWNRGRSCISCRKRHRKCISTDNNATCTQCHVLQINCVTLGSTSQPAGKRKKLEIDNSSESECESSRTNREDSSITMVCEDTEGVIGLSNGRNRKKTRAPETPRSQRKQSRAASTLHNNPRPEICKICNTPPRKNASNPADKTMIECDTCQTWYHVTCLWFSEDHKKPMGWFSPETGQLASQKVNIFFCPDCLDATKGGCHSEYLTKALENARDMLKFAAAHVISRAEGTMTALSAQQQKQQLQLQDEGQRRGICDHEFPDQEFQPARNMKYQGYDGNEFRDMIRRLDESIDNYSAEVNKAIVVYADRSSSFLKNPLRSWRRVDSRWRSVSGKEWYDMESIQHISCHTALTAALRKMLNIPIGEDLNIYPDLHSLSFSQVHTGLVNCFVFDLLNGKHQVDEWSSLTATKALMTAVKQSGDERWPGHGKDLLREVRLRMMNVSAFEAEIPLHQQYLTRWFESYLEPLTGDYNKIESWALYSEDVINHALKLCFYHQALGGKTDIFFPKHGDLLDPKRHEIENEELLQHRATSSTLAVKWTLRPGFIYREDGIDGTRELMIRAKVVV